jgi:hypothetical protein
MSHHLSPVRQQNAEDRFMHSNMMWSVTSKYIKDKLKQKQSLIEQQEKAKISREDFFMPTAFNGGKPAFLSRKGKSRDLPDNVRLFYQSLRFGKDGCGIVYEPINPSNPYQALFAI